MKVKLHIDNVMFEHIISRKFDVVSLDGWYSSGFLTIDVPFTDVFFDNFKVIYIIIITTIKR